MTSRIDSTIQVLIIVFTLVTGMYKTATADRIDGVSLGASSIVDAFNNANDGRGVEFTSAGYDGGAHYLCYQARDGKEFTDTSAYTNFYENEKTPVNSIYTTFMGAPGGYTVTACTLKLMYADGQSNPNVAASYVTRPLTVGAAYLYTLFATTDLELQRGIYWWGYSELEDAIKFLNGYYGSWAYANKSGFLKDMLMVNGDMDYWTSAYDPDAYYEEIGNYSVFVMDMYVNRYGDPQYGYYLNNNMLYIAGAAKPYDPNVATPEPATMLILGMGLCALPFTRSLRKK